MASKSKQLEELVINFWKHVKLFRNDALRQTYFKTLIVLITTTGLVIFIENIWLVSSSILIAGIILYHILSSTFEDTATEDEKVMHRIRHLENVRRDFVSNVSHELRTPITSIKGSVETILDGAIEQREDLLKFLNIAFKHSNRLEKIIEGLLKLSRVEQESEAGGIELLEQNLVDIVLSAIDLCSYTANNKNTFIKFEKPEQVNVMANRRLLEQALMNLIDNAIKYSPEKSQVLVSIKRKTKHVQVNIKDNGPGISEEHLPRLFERFYRVDKARSRALGGSGLGLALVKHIAQAHGGSVKVKSKVGVGSTFSITLPT